jgi:hypothetical protein
MRQIIWKILFEKKGIAMRNSRVRQNPMKNGRRKTIQDSIRRGLNPQDLRALVRALG